MIRRAEKMSDDLSFLSSILGSSGGAAFIFYLFNRVLELLCYFPIVGKHSAREHSVMSKLQRSTVICVICLYVFLPSLFISLTFSRSLAMKIAIHPKNLNFGIATSLLLAHLKIRKVS